jgi:hypothetical protein
MGTWRKMIRYWKSGGAGQYYQVGLVLPYEWMVDPIKGPMVVQQLADLYRQVGFEVAPPSDIPCIWYQMASKEWKRQEQLLTDYIPGYTAAQRDFMLAQIEEEWNEEKDDPVLKILLQEYKDQILTETRIDVPATSIGVATATGTQGHS